MKNAQKEALRKRIRALAFDQGFEEVGFSLSRYLEEEAPRLEDWLNQGYHGKMGYMENWFDLRLDPSKLVEGAKSVITFIQNYSPSELQRGDSYKIARYAYGEDYHFVIKRKLKTIAKEIEEDIGEFTWRAFVDSGPVLDRVWAKNSGLGWIGKNSLLLNKDRGSYFFIGHLITDLELGQDPVVSDHCGTCTACIDACPTDAIVEPYKVDGSKCISYFTIELKESIPNEFKGNYQDWIFGCDICQEVCPWISKSKPHDESSFEPKGDWIGYTKEDWENLSEQDFSSQFKKAALMRAGFSGVKKNIEFLKG